MLFFSSACRSVSSDEEEVLSESWSGSSELASSLTTPSPKGLTH